MTENETNHDARDEERLSRLSGGRAANDDAVVEEYEQRYRPEPRRKRKAKPRSYSTWRISDEDKLWAAVAHGSVWITFLLSAPTSGVSLPFVVFVPLAIYLLFRDRSDFVAFHALQAFVLQLVCTIGAITGLIVGGLIWLIGLAIAALLMVVLIGFVIMPLWVLVGIVASIALSVLPLVGLVFATIATVRVYRGDDFRYPFIADWIDRQMAGGLLNA